jgi:hypothetical protein
MTRGNEIRGNAISGKRSSWKCYSQKGVYGELCFRGNGPWRNEIRGNVPNPEKHNVTNICAQIFIFLECSILEQKILSSFTQVLYKAALLSNETHSVYE